MAVVDKLCDICLQYCPTDKRGKRFAYQNVGHCCIGNKPLKGRLNSGIRLVKVLGSGRVRGKGFMWYISDCGLIKWVHSSQLEGAPTGKPLILYVKVTIPADNIAESYNKDERYSLNVFASNKRSMRRLLRKLGITGKISEVIK